MRVAHYKARRRGIQGRKGIGDSCENHAERRPHFGPKDFGRRCGRLCLTFTSVLLGRGQTAHKRSKFASTAAPDEDDETGRGESSGSQVAEIDDGNAELRVVGGQHLPDIFLSPPTQPGYL